MSSPALPIQKLIKKQSIAFLAAASLASALMIAVGILAEPRNNFLATLAIATGGSALGTCFGIVFGGIADASTLQRVRELVEESTISPLSASEHDLEPLRTNWHKYIVSESGNSFVWRYEVLDFGLITVPNKLTTVVQDPIPNTNDFMNYKIDGFIIGSRLVLTSTPAAGGEPPPVHLYPSATQEFRQLHPGIVTLQTWDGNELTSPAIMSKRRIDLDAPYSEGTVPSEVNGQLNDIWEKASKTTGLTMVRGADT